MYAALWRKLPGPWPAKLIWSSALLAGTVALLFSVVFPWLEPRLPFNDVTVDETTSGPEEPGPATPSPGSTGPDGTVREITSPGEGPTVTPSVVGSPAPSAS
ncbi:MAG: hypothetical protein U0S36_04205 [Candidatus Nanopelagicales bacterium]